MTALAEIKSSKLETHLLHLCEVVFGSPFKSKAQYVEYSEPSFIFSSPDIIFMVYDIDQLY